MVYTKIVNQLSASAKIDLRFVIKVHAPDGKAVYYKREDWCALMKGLIMRRGCFGIYSLLCWFKNVEELFGFA